MHLYFFKNLNTVDRHVSTGQQDGYIVIWSCQCTGKGRWGEWSKSYGKWLKNTWQPVPYPYHQRGIAQNRTGWPATQRIFENNLSWFRTEFAHRGVNSFRRTYRAEAWRIKIPDRQQLSGLISKLDKKRYTTQHLLLYTIMYSHYFV